MFIDDNEGTNDAALTHQTLIDTQERLGALLDLMPTGLVIHQMQGVLYANRQALSLFGQDSEAFVGKHLLDYVDDDIREDCTNLFMSAFIKDEPVRLPEMRLSSPCGKTHFIKATAGRLPWEGTTVIQVLLEDITELKIKEEKLRSLTYLDPLTGAYNRRYFIKHSEDLIRTAIGDEENFSLMIFDVDLFKSINDTYGHQAGDKALKEIVRVWNENTRHNEESKRQADGCLSRIGGEEFAIILSGLCKKEAGFLAERIRCSIEQITMNCEDHNFNLTASFGVTDLRDGDDCIDDLIRRADIALYRAKGSGRNRVETE